MSYLLPCVTMGRHVTLPRTLYTGKGAENMTRAFTVVLERDPETKWLVGEVVELPGCYTQAPDMPTLEANIKEAIAAYLQTVDVPR